MYLSVLSVPDADLELWVRAHLASYPGKITQARILVNHGEGERPGWRVKEVKFMVENPFLGRAW